MALHLIPKHSDFLRSDSNRSALGQKALALSCLVLCKVRLAWCWVRSLRSLPLVTRRQHAWTTFNAAFKRCLAVGLWKSLRKPIANRTAQPGSAPTAVQTGLVSGVLCWFVHRFCSNKSNLKQPCHATCQKKAGGKARCL